MIHLNPASRSQPLLRFIPLAALTLLGSLLVLIVIQGAAQRPEPSFDNSAFVQTDAQRTSEPVKSPVIVTVNALQKSSTDLGALNAVFQKMTAWNERLPLPGDTPHSLTTGSASLPDWFVWGRLGGAHAESIAKIPQEIDPKAVRFYPAQSPEGTTLCLANHSPRTLWAKVILRLPPGVYKTEALSFRVSEAASSPRVAQLERLSGREITQNGGTLNPIITLEPDEIVFVRATDMARQARLALNDVNRLLKHFARMHFAQAKRLQTMLNEASAYVTGMNSMARRITLGKRLNCVHRTLLYTGQAQSLYGNYLAKGLPDAAVGAELKDAFERVTDALAETSAVMLGLVPRISVTFAPPVTSHLTGLQGEATPHLERKATITLALAHQGSQSLRDVKLGIDARNLPRGMSCSPAVPDYFPVLAPGQSITSRFVVRGVAGEMLPANRFRGEISYFSVGAPAHLRPRPW